MNTTPYGNIPRDVQYPFLNGRMQSVYESDVYYGNMGYMGNTGNMGYPYYVQRVPQVLPNPKPTSVEVGDYSYQIPKYPPYLYWYPNPVECADSCGAAVCNAYGKKMNDYRMCQRCQSMKTPQCWNASAQKCQPCRPEKALTSCEDQFGCANPTGWLQSRGAPINPKYTGCRLCNN